MASTTPEDSTTDGCELSPQRDDAGSPGGASTSDVETTSPTIANGDFPGPADVPSAIDQLTTSSSQPGDPATMLDQTEKQDSAAEPATETDTDQLEKTPKKYMPLQKTVVQHIPKMPHLAQSAPRRPVSLSESSSSSTPKRTSKQRTNSAHELRRTNSTWVLPPLNRKTLEEEGLDLKHVFDNPRLYAMFHDFLEASKSAENLSFYSDVNRFKSSFGSSASINSEAMLHEAKAIFDRYLDRTSPHEINIDFSVRKEIVRRIEAKNVTPTLFDEAQHSVYVLLQMESYRKFVSSIEFRAYYMVHALLKAIRTGDEATMRRALVALGSKITDEAWFHAEFLSQGGVDVLCKTILAKDGNTLAIALDILLELSPLKPTATVINTATAWDSVSDDVIVRLAGLVDDDTTSTHVLKSALSILAQLPRSAKHGFDSVDYAFKAAARRRDVLPYSGLLGMLARPEVDLGVQLRVLSLVGSLLNTARGAAAEEFEKRLEALNFREKLEKLGKIQDPAFREQLAQFTHIGTREVLKTKRVQKFFGESSIDLRTDSGAGAVSIAAQPPHVKAYKLRKRFGEAAVIYTDGADAAADDPGTPVAAATAVAQGADLGSSHSESFIECGTPVSTTETPPQSTTTAATTATTVDAATSVSVATPVGDEALVGASSDSTMHRKKMQHKLHTFFGQRFNVDDVIFNERMRPPSQIVNEPPPDPNTAREFVAEQPPTVAATKINKFFGARAPMRKASSASEEILLRRKRRALTVNADDGDEDEECEENPESEEERRRQTQRLRKFFGEKVDFEHEAGAVAYAEQPDHVKSFKLSRRFGSKTPIQPAPARTKAASLPVIPVASDTADASSKAQTSDPAAMSSDSTNSVAENSAVAAAVSDSAVLAVSKSEQQEAGESLSDGEENEAKKRAKKHKLHRFFGARVRSISQQFDREAIRASRPVNREHRDAEAVVQRGVVKKLRRLFSSHR